MNADFLMRAQLTQEQVHCAVTLNSRKPRGIGLMLDNPFWFCRFLLIDKTNIVTI